MRVLLLSGGSAIHTIRWANGLAKAGLEVNLVTQQRLLEDVSRSVTVTQLRDKGAAGYFLMARTVRRIAVQWKANVLNAHYASGYGTAANLAGVSPYLLSVWGSDVYDFPMRSRAHKWLLRRNVLAADKVASTSRCMAEQVRRIVPECQGIAITPFGVDIERFSRVARPGGGGSYSGEVTVGTVKTLASKYGVDTLLRAFALLRGQVNAEAPELGRQLRLRIVGEGPDRTALEQLAENLCIADVTAFVGRVPHGAVPGELEKLDVFVALSRLDSESFGVAIIEASAAGRPVVVSDAGGLPEVTLDGVTGIVVPRDDHSAAAAALKSLVMNPDQRREMGEAGAAHVSKTYSWHTSVRTMINVLEDTINSSRPITQRSGR